MNKKKKYLFYFISNFYDTKSFMKSSSKIQNLEMNLTIQPIMKAFIIGLIVKLRFNFN